MTDDVTTQRYARLCADFLTYAEHPTSCKWWTHRHKYDDIKWLTTERRAECQAVPCTCGLIEALRRMRIGVNYSYACPDEQQTPPTSIRPRVADITVPPHTLWGLPVFETDTVPPGHIQVRSGDRTIEVEVTDAETGAPVEQGLRLVGNLSVFPRGALQDVEAKVRVDEADIPPVPETD